MSAALVIPTRPDHDFAREVVAIIDAIHTDGAITPIAVDYGAFPGMGARASARFSAKRRAIDVCSRAADPSLSLAHEIGHALDFAIGAGKPASENDPRFAGWKAAVQRTPLVRHITAMAVQTTSPQRRYDLSTYVLSNSELWARSYAQYVAIRSGSSRLRRDLVYARGGYGGGILVDHWGDQEFSPVADVIDDLFRVLRWIP